MKVIITLLLFVLLHNLVIAALLSSDMNTKTVSYSHVENDNSIMRVYFD